MSGKIIQNEDKETEKRLLKRITVITIVLIVSFFLFNARTDIVYAEGYDEDIYLVFVTNENETQEIKLYKNNEGYHVFLPSNANLNNFSIQSDESVSVVIDGKTISSGETADLTETAETELLFDGEDQIKYPLIVHTLSDIPSLWITTKSGSMTQVHESKENRETAVVKCITSDGTVSFESSAKIKCHGYTSFYYANKKSYHLKFDDDVQMLGMGEAKKWILTSNIFDSSKLRNALSYYLAQKLELPYAVNAEYVDLYVNNEYLGNYLIHDSVELNRERIDIPANGSFLIVTGHREGEEDLFFKDDYGNTYSLKDPDYLEEDHLEEIRNYMNEIQKTILELGENDELDYLNSLIDVDSLVTMFLIDEITDEVDANVWSTYYYYNGEDGLLHAGPAWDFDRSIGGVIHFNNYSKINSFINGFPEQLWKNSNFKKLVKEKLAKYPDLYDDAIKFLDDSADMIKESVEADKTIWGYTMGGFVDTGNTEHNIEYVKQFFKERFELIRNIVSDPDEYVSLNIVRKGKERTIWLKKGEKLSSSELEYLCESYNCDYFSFGNGTQMWDNFPIFEDLILTTGPERTEQTIQKEGEKGMEAINFIIFVIVFFPGLLTLFISGKFKGRKLSELIIQYGSYTFCIIVLTFALMYFIMGEKTINWGGTLEGFDYNMSHIGVAFKVIALQFTESIVLGILIRLSDRIRKKEVTEE